MLLSPGNTYAQKKHPTRKNERADAAPQRFSRRAETLLQNGLAAKGEWGLLIADAETGETLFEENASRYFVPASNMKLFTTALALDKLGPDFVSTLRSKAPGSLLPMAS